MNRSISFSSGILLLLFSTSKKFDAVIDDDDGNEIEQQQKKVMNLNHSRACVYLVTFFSFDMITMVTTMTMTNDDIDIIFDFFGFFI